MIDEILKKLSTTLLTRNQNTGHVKMMVKGAKLVRVHETLTDKQHKKIDWAIDGLSELLLELQERDKILDQLKKSKGLPTSNDLAKAILKLTLNNQLTTYVIDDLELETPITTLKDAVIDPGNYDNMVKTLQKKKVLDESLTLSRPAVLLYSLIKRFKRLGVFKKMENKYLHELVNTAFKVDKSFNSFKNAPIYDKSIE